MFNLSMPGHLCLSPRVKQLTQLSRPFFQCYNMMASDSRTPQTPKDLSQQQICNPEMQQFPQTPKRICEAGSTPKYRRPGHQFCDSEMTQSTRPSRLMQCCSGTSFEAYSQQFFSQYRFDMTPRTTEAAPTTPPTPTTMAMAMATEEEEEEQKLVGFIERLNKVDVESSEFLSMFPNPQEAIQLIEYLRERVQDPEVRTIWDLLEQLPANLRDQVDMEGIGFSATKQRSLYVHSKSSKKLERFKVRTLDFSGVVRDGSGT